MKDEVFTIKDIENLTGVKTHTLRIWQQRDDLLVPKRKESLHGVYNNEDLKQLLRISFLFHSGWKISRIAALRADEIESEVSNVVINSKNYKNFILKMIEAAVDFNEAAFVQIIEELNRKIGFENCITQICYPYSQRMGMVGLTNNIIPAQEHFSSYIIQNKIIAETNKLVLNSKEPQALLFSPKGAHHQLPLLFIYYLLKKNGWNVIYLGSNITKEALKQFTQNNNVKYLFLHLITHYAGWDADGYFENLCRTFPTKTIVAMGTAIKRLQRNFVNVNFLKEDKAIYKFIEKRQKCEAENAV